MSKYNTSFKARLLAGSALVAATLAVPSSSAYAQATIDLDFATATADLTAVYGTMLEQFTAGNVTGTTSGGVGTINLTTDTTTDTTYSGAYTLDDNAFASEADGNDASGTVDLTFTPGVGTDTAAAGVFQDIGLDDSVTATVTGSDHVVLIENTGTGEAILTGTLTVDNNDLLATARGNIANSTITLASGVNVTGTGDQATTAIDSRYAATPPAAFDSDNSADMLVSQAQGFGGGTSSVESTVTGSDVEVRVEELQSTTLTVSNSDVQAASTGNTIAGSIESNDTTASIGAAAAVTGMQALVDTDVESSVLGADILVRAGTESDGDETGEVKNSTVILTANDLTASSIGSTAAQSVSLVANQITGGATAVVADTPAVAGVQLTATGDAVVASVQTMDQSSTVDSQVSSGAIQLNVDDDDEPASGNGFEVTNNTITSTALGVNAANVASLQAGSTLSAPAAVASVQLVEGDISASVVDSFLEFDTDDDADVSTSSILVTGNAIRAAATGASVDNDIAVANTDILSFATNAGSVSIVADPVSPADPLAPSVTAAYSLANDQVLAGSSVSAANTSNRVYIDFEDDSISNTANLDSNTLSASVVGAAANNAISLSFNQLAGTGTTDGDVVAAAANSQRVEQASAVTASVYGQNGRPVDFNLDEQTYQGDGAPGGQGNSFSVSSNVVSASATANRSTGTTVTVDATNVVIATGIQATAQVNKGDGDVTASAAFVAANSQELDSSSVTAHQVDDIAAAANSNTIRTQLDRDVIDTTVLSNSNQLSVSAAGNTAVTGVNVGTGATSTIRATAASVNYQDVADSAINAVLGTVGSDGSTSFSSANGGSGTATGTLSLAGAILTANAPYTVNMAAPLTAEEAAIVNAVFGAGAVAGATSFTIPVGGGYDTSVFNNFTISNGIGGPLTGDETASLDGFASASVPPSLNTAGVIIDPGSDNSQYDVTDSTLAVNSNVIAGEVRGNVATNTIAATATTLTRYNSTLAVSTDTDAATVVATAADNALTSVQEIDGTSALTSTVAGSFAVTFQDDQDIDDSTITVNDNLLQSFGTSNNAANSVTLTATNSSAGAALLNEQTMTAPAGSGVVTVSDMDVATSIGMVSSDQALDNNTNQSVASANVETSVLTVSVTNADPVTGTGSNASFVEASKLLTGDAVLATEQDVTGTPTISATATTDVFNRDFVDVTARPVVTSTLSLSSNDTVAQATANNSTARMTLGDSGTASYDASGAIRGDQDIVADTVVTATSDVEVGMALRTNDGTVATLQASTVSINGSTATALARGNVQSTTLSVAGANIDAGGTTDAVVDATGNQGAFLLDRDQNSAADVRADSSSSVFSLVATGENSTTGASAGSTLSVSSNVSSATALANTATNTVMLGSGSTASLDSTGNLESFQNAQAGGSVTAVGGISASAQFSSGTADNSTVVTGSTLTMSGNVSNASATANNVTNTYTANATNMTAGTDDTDSSISAASVTAANILSSTQLVSQDVTATNTANAVAATVSSGPADTGETAVGVNASTVALTGNAFNAFATGNSAGNTAANSMALGGAGTSSLTASGALRNVQTQNAGIRASGSGTVQVVVDGAVDAVNPGSATALNASTVSVADNSVMAMARGNLANNSLSVGATSVTAGDGTGGYDSSAGQVTAAFGLLNRQTNNGAVDATSDGARFQVALNTLAVAPDTAASSSTVGVSGNSVMAAAYGNVATNNLSVASLEGASDDATAITGNYQLASGGAITANVTGGFAGVTAIGPVGTSTVAVRGNTFTSKAVGNFATSVVTRR